MALSTTGAALGDQNTYQISPQIKRYTLMDVGFIKTNNGNFQLERSLDPNSPYTAANKLKITVSKDLDKFQISATTGNGMKAVDIFKHDATKDNVEQYEYLMDNLIDRGVFELKK
ncbi:MULTISPECIES: DUF1831 domain-containing protein [Lacticaseibacillus]|uniref:DUF1831 domain-containing protein n=2 Tax=Lacticaseibacillus TaxID=2759736 RepID=A0ABW4CLM0_9LACO|nr:MULTISPECIES: DUF1831 domain-containing protein [Lacticaseibacillus]